MVDRIGPPPLSLQPLGLLDFLGIKNGGEYPQYMPNQLQPSIDLLQWYAQTNARQYELQRTVFNANSNAGIGGWTTTSPAGNPLFVPNNEVWYVTHYAVGWQFSASAGGNIPGAINVAFSDELATNQLQIPDQSSSGALSSNAGVTSGGVSSMQRPFFLKPGWRPMWFSQGILLAGATLWVFGEITYVPFKV